MKKSVVTFYSVLVILILAGTAGWIGYTYFTENSENQALFSENMGRVSSDVATLLEKSENPGAEEFRQGMEKIVQSRDEIKGILIYSSDNSLYYNRMESRSKRLMGNLRDNETYLVEKINDGSYRPPLGYGHMSASLANIQNIPLEISYIYETFSPVQIYDMLRMALYIVSSLFVLTLLFLLFLSNSEKKSRVEGNDDFFEPPEVDPTLPPVDPNSGVDFEALGDVNVDFSGDEPLSDDLDDMDFDLPDDDLGSMDFDLPEEEATDDELGSMDFDLPEEEATDDDLGSMDFDLPEEEATDDDLGSMDFDLPEEEATDGDLGSMDFDLPEEESGEEEDYPKEMAELDDLDDLDEPDESSDLDDLDDFNLDDLDDLELPEEPTEIEASSEADEEEEEVEGGDLFDDLEDLVDLDDEADDLLGGEAPSLEEEEPEELSLDDFSDDDILEEDFTALDEGDDDLEDLDLPDLDEFKAEGIEEEEIPAEGEPEVLEDGEDEDKQKLYSPRSNVCWEDFIEERLPQELDRASSENEDISFVYMRDQSVQTDEDYALFSEVLTKDFPYRDMIFEWGDQGFAMILPNSDLVESLEKLDVFINEHPERDIRIGATSRNGRLLDKDQLIEEASSAISRTSVENKIIGFRADPERYREAISRE